VTNDPCDLRLERDVIGSCLLRPDTIAALGLTLEDFSSEANQALWSALSDMASANERIDAVRLRSKLLDRQQLEVAGGEPAIEKLRYVGKPSTLPIDRLKQLTKMRSLRAAAELVAATCVTGDLDASVAALADAHGAAMGSVQRKRTQDVLELCMPLLEELANNTESVPRVHPGYVLLEECLGSIPEGCTVAVLASTNVGKSTFALEMLVRAAQRNVACGYLSVEDQEPVVRSRIVGMLSGVSSRKILQRKLDVEDLRKLAVAYDHIASLKEKLHVSILQGGTDADACASLSELAARGAKMVVVDYLQKIGASKAYQNKAHEVSASATRITSHAQRLGLACILVSQCTRDKTKLNECPSKHDMKESGDLENMVDAIIGLWREREDDLSPIWAKLLKVKWGGVGQSWRLQRDPETGRVEEVPGSNFDTPPGAPDRRQQHARGY
jgi:replicative DNA helicase